MQILSRFDANLKGMEELQQLLKYATQNLDQVIYIASHVTKNVAESVMAYETFTWKTALVRDFDAYRKTQLLWETKNKIEDLTEIKNSLTVISSVLETFFEEQKTIL